MKKHVLVAALGAGLLVGSVAEAGPIKRACMKSDRSAASRELCSCIEKVARPMFSRSEERRIARFFKNPDLTQEVRASSRASDERFWEKYQRWGELAEARCR